MVSWKTYESVKRACVNNPEYITIHSALELEDDQVEEIAQIIIKQHEERSYHKEHVGKGPLKKAERLRAIVKIRRYSDSISTEYDDYYCLMNDKFMYCLATGSWRIKGRNKWYMSKSPEDFIENYVLKDNE